MALLSTFIASQRYAEVTPYIKGNVLELGCQNSLLLGNSNYNISKYYGVEKSTNLVNKLTKQYPDATFLQRDLDRDTLGLDNIFDCVLMVALIEHLYNQKFVFEGVARALKSGGIAAIPHRRCWEMILYCLWGPPLGFLARLLLNNILSYTTGRDSEILPRQRA